MGGRDDLTRTESATLAAVERRLGNAEIAQEFGVSVRTVESHIASLRRKLGVDSRAGLIAAARDRRGRRVNVPRDSFVGRDDDVASVDRALRRGRWVTVVGPAGAGKTRLALEIAAASDRVPIVAELEHADPDEVLGVVAKAIGVTADRTTGVVVACGVALRAQRCLLVLDNCDRVLDAVADVVESLLDAADSVLVLATSRSPVGGGGEVVHVLAPLAVDRDGAVRLFTDRARTAAPTLARGDDDAELVDRICRRLDGLPLAIELAAARLRHLSLAELDARLAHDFGALDRARPDGRHRTLETAFDWTWDLLDDEERSVLSRLAALPRTFDLELAEHVTHPGAGRVVMRLLDRSLVTPAASAVGPRRFRLLDAMREIVLTRTDAAVTEQVRAGHAAYFAAQASGVAGRARQDDSPQTAARAASLCVEVNAAADWALEHHDPLAVTITSALAVGAEQFAPDLDSLDAIARASRAPFVRSQATTAQLFVLGMALCYWDLDLVGDLAETALERADDPLSRLDAHHLAGYADAYRGRTASALEHLAVAETLAIDLDDTWQLASVLQARGLALRGRQPIDAEGAIEAFAAAMQAYAVAGDRMHVNNTRYMMAATAADARVQTQQAAAWVEQCADYARECGNRHELAHAVLTRATLGTSPFVEDDLLGAVAEFSGSGDLRCLTRSTLLLAAHRPLDQRVPLLREALDVARRAHDRGNQVVAAERLIAAEWESGARRAAVVELGTLSALIGEEDARARCPGGMLAELDRWDTALLEGRARAAAETRR